MNTTAKFFTVARTAFLALCLSLAQAGCGVVKTIYASSDKFDNEQPGDSEPHARDDAFVQEVADRFGLMAWFAEVSYRRDLDGSQEHETACDYLTTGEPVDFGMPPQDEQGRWLRWIPQSDSEQEKEVKSCLVFDGLFYETYVYQLNNGLIEQAAITFRGTENSNGQFWVDWSTNLSATFGFEPGQYELARNALPAVIQRLKDLNPDVRIFAVGHSLGGGLAQQTGYQFNEVEAVYTFNTSPVTNWTNLRLNSCNGNGEESDGDDANTNCVANDWPTIYRVYHTGEVLSKVRNISTTFTSSRYGRYDLGVQFQPKTSFKGHSMQILACGFADIISEDTSRSGDANHHYTLEFIDGYVLKSRACDDYQQAMAFNMKTEAARED